MTKKHMVDIGESAEQVATVIVALDRVAAALERLVLLVADVRNIVATDIPEAVIATHDGEESDRCSQCGRLFADPACGPTHAVVAAQHRGGYKQVGISGVMGW